VVRPPVDPHIPTNSATVAINGLTVARHLTWPPSTGKRIGPESSCSVAIDEEKARSSKVRVGYLTFKEYHFLSREVVRLRTTGNLQFPSEQGLRGKLLNRLNGDFCPR
jgi:hypothetical protein